MPQAHGLFHKAIAQSGATANVLSLATADAVTAAFLTAFGTTDFEALLTASPESIVTAQKVVEAQLLADPGSLAGIDGIALAMPFQPVLDGIALPDAPQIAIERGLSSDVALLAGTTADEWNLFHLMSPGGLDDPTLLRRADSLVPHLGNDGASLIETYRKHRPDASADELWCAVLTDHVFRIPAIRMLEAQSRHQPNNTFQYLFSWASRAFDGKLGSCHALEIPFVFNTLEQPGAEMFLGTDQDVSELALALHDAWIAFAHTGNPSHAGLAKPWPTFDTNRREVVEFGETIQLLRDPGAAEREIWNSASVGQA